MTTSSNRDDLARALDAIAGVEAVPHCLLPLLGRQMLFVAAPDEGRAPELLPVYTGPGREDARRTGIEWQEVSVRELIDRVVREGRNGFIIDPDSDRRLPVRGNDLAALKHQLEKAVASGSGIEMVECDRGDEMIIATPDPVPPLTFIATLSTSLRQGGTYRAAWLFDMILPGGKEGELCLGIEPDGTTDAVLLESRANTAFQSDSARPLGRPSLAFLLLDDPELAELVRGIGIRVDDGGAG
ncbi:MAG TPA: hypothetical protein VIV61_12885 [Candidatus Ozemobacteraceae bacterium]